MGEVLSYSLAALDARALALGFSYKYVPFRTSAEVIDFYAGKFDYEQYTCMLPWTTTRISPTGDVFPCLNYRIGNIRQQSLDSRWKHERYREFRNVMEGRRPYQNLVGR